MAATNAYVGLAKVLSETLASGENWLLKLYTNNSAGVGYTPTASDTASTYTEASISGYSAITLTRSVTSATWGTPSAGVTPSVSNYNGSTGVTFSFTGTGTVYGYYIVSATTGILIGAEKFATPFAIYNPSTLTVKPAYSQA